MILKIQTVNLMAPWWMSGMLTWATLALLSPLWQTSGIPKLQVARSVLTNCICVTPCQCYVWLTKDWPLIQIFVVKYQMQHQHAHCPLAWGQAGSQEYWIRSNGCKGTAIWALGRQSKKVRQLNNLSISVFVPSDWYCLIFFRIMNERATRMGERARLMEINQDMRCDLVFFTRCGIEQEIDV